MQKRRYEILLPAKYNDGRDIMNTCMECFPKTLMEVLDHFGALSYTPNAVMGVWTAAGMRYDDELAKLTVDVEDRPDNVHFITHLKAELLARFAQLEIYVVAYPVEVL